MGARKPKVVFRDGKPPITKGQVKAIAKRVERSAFTPKDALKLFELIRWLERERADFEAAATEEARAYDKLYAEVRILRARPRGKAR